MEEKIEQLYYIRSEMMRLLNQLKLLTNYISDETNIANTQTLGHLSNNIANKRIVTIANLCGNPNANNLWCI